MIAIKKHKIKIENRIEVQRNNLSQSDLQTLLT